MPLYEFKCDKCGHRFEVLMSGSSENPKACPSCGAAAPQKLFSSFAVGAGAGPKKERPACSGCDHSSCPYAKG